MTCEMFVCISFKYSGEQCNTVAPPVSPSRASARPRIVAPENGLGKDVRLFPPH
eukprot:COSAG01_NODE_2419_length_7731_cov_34.853138_2_plen_54_part_00